MRFPRFPAVLLTLALMAIVVDARAQREGKAPTAKSHVLFVLGRGDEKIVASESLKAAIRAQLAGTDTDVDFVSFDGAPKTLREQVAGARALAEDRGAIGIFWLEMAVDGDWLLYLAEPGVERILVRRLKIDSPSAGAEAVGVITGHSAAALASGETIGMEPIQALEPARPSPPPEPEISPFEPLPDLSPRARVEPPPPPRSGPRLAFGYRGTTFSDQLPFQHGIAGDLHWISKGGPIAGVELSTFSPSASPSDLVTLQIERTSVGASVGWRLASDPLALELEVSYIGEAVRRTALSAADGVESGAPHTRWQSELGGVLRGELDLSRALSLFVGVGAHYVLNNFQSIAIIDGESRAVSTPFSVRASVRAGVLVWP